MESFCTFFYTPFLELNLLLENNSVGNPLAVKGLNFLKAGNSEKNGPARIKPFRCVLEHAYIKCIHFQLFLLKIWETLCSGKK